ncbi:MAG: GNAT family N-acetyltransferase [Candidatus Binatus sp.]|uniref:GNAT family N-acetyltransferase n=1 Tax=Candidatus Binatus sp. TaxID=2811406 RepID=UPI003C9502EF
MSVRIESPSGEEALTEFVLFQHRVYEYRSARWAAMVPVQLPVLMGDGPFAAGRKFRPFTARVDGEIVARALAIIDSHYQHHWKESLGHIVMFEAMPGTRDAVKLMMDAASEWIKANGAKAARAGFGLLEFPFVIDDYETLPPDIARQNPAYYHALLKDAGFETERGWVDYKIEVTPELVARYESALEASRRAGFQIVALKDLPAARRLHDFEHTWNTAFARHWGATPFSTGELAFLFELFAMFGALDTSVLAYRGEQPVGALMVTPATPDGAILKPGRTLGDHEKLNFLGIGVLEEARGRGVNLAMAAYAYLHLIRAGAKYLSYTLVLDDNWPSRRTAEKLGAKVCANYVTYRRNF